MILIRFLAVLSLMLTFVLALLTGAAQALPGPGIAATVTVWSDDGDERFLGSGFVFGDAHRVVTNAHVVGRLDRVVLQTETGARLPARVVARDQQRDLALLQADRPIGIMLQPAGTKPVPGDTVFAIGAPLGTGLSVTAGIVSALDRQIDPQQPVLYLQHAAPVNPGSSGGPLLNAKGAVVGMNTRIVDGSRYFVGIAYAVPVADILAFLADPHRPAPVSPGLDVRAISQKIAQALGLPDRQGLLVEHVAAASPAARAGVRAGDILLRLGDDLVNAAVNTPGDMALILARATPSSITIRRGDTVHTLALDLSPPPRPVAPSNGALADAKNSYTLREMGLSVGKDGQIDETTQGTTGFYAGLSLGDRIRAINGKPLAQMPAGWQDEMQFTGPVLLRILLSDGTNRHILLDPWAKTPRLRPSSGANVMDQEVVSFD